MTTCKFGIASAFAATLAIFSSAAFAQDTPKADAPAAAPAAEAPAADAKKDAAPAAPAEGAPAAAPAAEAAAPAAGGKKTAMELLTATEKGKLKNPFTGNAEAIAEGHKIYMGASCNGCHGGGGGGGMCPPLTNETWVYGGDDDTLFRLVTLGSQELQKHGYARKGQEGVVGPMPGYKDIDTPITKDADNLWKAIAWMRSIWKGREEKKQW